MKGVGARETDPIEGRYQRLRTVSTQLDTTGNWLVAPEGSYCSNRHRTFFVHASALNRTPIRADKHRPSPPLPYGPFHRRRLPRIRSNQRGHRITFRDFLFFLFVEYSFVNISCFYLVSSACPFVVGGDPFLWLEYPR